MVARISSFFSGIELGKHDTEYYLNRCNLLARKYDDHCAIKDAVHDKIFEQGGPKGQPELILLKIALWGKPFYCFFAKGEFEIEVV